ncbi:MAG: cupin domain-containing protein [Spirochaetaceae bacterium]|nr:cupin domain-containing protein [Spirochaetaceae bacterium]
MGEKKYLITKEEAVSGVLAGGAGTFRIFIDGPICGAKNVALLQNTMIAGKSGPIHSHPTEHCMYILSGKGTFKIDGQTMSLVPGTAVFVPPNVDHQTIVNPEGDLDYIIIYAPAGPEQKLREKGAYAFDK